MSYSTVCLDPTIPQKFPLNKSGSAWIELSHLPESLTTAAIIDFEKLFALHPEDRGKVIVHKHDVDAHRWYRSYMHAPVLDMKTLKSSYMFSSIDGMGIEETVPAEFMPYVAASAPYANQVVVNWYGAESDYIPFHRDYCQGMSKDQPITVLTLTGDDTQPRKFCVRRMDDTIDALYDRVEIPTICGLIIKLCGDTNECFKHGCPKATGGKPRISMSFRHYE